MLTLFGIVGNPAPSVGKTMQRRRRLYLAGSSWRCSDIAIGSTRYGGLRTRQAARQVVHTGAASVFRGGGVQKGLQPPADFCEGARGRHLDVTAVNFALNNAPNIWVPAIGQLGTVAALRAEMDNGSTETRRTVLLCQPGI